MVKEGYKYINFINFSSLKEWDFKRYNIYSTSSEYPIEKLGKHIVHQTKKHNLFDYPSKTFGILGISNEIGMFDAYEEKGEKIRQAYKIVENGFIRSEEHTSELQSRGHLVCRLLLEKKKKRIYK